LKPLKDEAARLRAVIHKKFPEREPEFDLALNTGLRIEEYSLRWQNVDWEQRRLAIPGKGKKLRHVPLNVAALDALAKRRKLAPDSELVCPGLEDHRAWWDAVRAEASIDYACWHDLRHTFASRLVMNGVDIYRVKELLGHGSVVTTERYAHLSSRHLHAAFEKLGSVTKSDTEQVRSARPDDGQLTYRKKRRRWCPGGESNPHEEKSPEDFKSSASAIPPPGQRQR
jgi:integrase